MHFRLAEALIMRDIVFIKLFPGMHNIPESDWKVFRNLHGALMERFFGRALDKVIRAASNPNPQPSERFFTVGKLVRERGKAANDLSDHRRSTAFFVIARMHNQENLFLPGEFERFSQETQGKVIGLRSL